MRSFDCAQDDDLMAQDDDLMAKGDMMGRRDTTLCDFIIIVDIFGNNVDKAENIVYNISSRAVRLLTNAKDNC